MKRILQFLSFLHTKFHNAGNIVREEMVEMNDGVKLFTVISLPASGTKFPVIILRNPYISGDEKSIEQWKANLRKNAQYGFALVGQCCRGTGRSEGDFIPYINEKADGLALLEWVRKQDFYNGEIFLEGGSYCASVFASWLNECPPDVKGAFWGVQDSERYNIIYRNGFLRLSLHCEWYLRVYKKNSEFVRDRETARFNAFPLAGFTERIFGERAADMEEVMLHPDRNDPFWKTPGAGGGEYSHSAANSRIPIFFAGAWHDIYAGGMFDMWRSLDPEHRKNCVFAITPFDHGYMLRKKNLLKEIYSPGGALFEFAPGKSIKYQWFEHIRNGGKLKYFKKGEINRFLLFGRKWVISPEVGTNSTPVKFFLSQERKLTTSPVNGGMICYNYDPRNPAVFNGGCDGVFGGVQYQDPPNSRPDIISFMTEPFEKDMVLEGACKVKLHVSSTAPDTCFYVRLSIVKKSCTLGLRNEIDSICRTNPEFLPDGEAVIDFELVPHHFKIARGEQLRLDVSSSCWPCYQLHSNFKGIQALQDKAQIAHNTVLLGRSYIEIPFAKQKFW